MSNKTPKERRQDFLDVLSVCGQRAKASKVSGIPLKTADAWRNPNSKDYDGWFTDEYKRALFEYMERLEAEALRRGVEGVERKVFYKGEEIDTETQYSDRMLELLLKANVPKFRDRQEVVNKNVDVNEGLKSLEDLPAEKREAMRQLLDELGTETDLS